MLELCATVIAIFTVMAENMLILKFTLISGFFVFSLLKCHAEDIRVQSPNIIAILADDMVRMQPLNQNG